MINLPNPSCLFNCSLHFINLLITQLLFIMDFISMEKMTLTDHSFSLNL